MVRYRGGMQKSEILTDAVPLEAWVGPIPHPPMLLDIARAAVQEAGGTWGPNAITLKAHELAVQTLARS